MKFSKIKNNNGLTLVELLIALSLVGLVVTVVFSFFMVGMRAYGKGNIQADMQYEVRRASNKISDEIRHAKSISLSSGSNSLTISDLIDSNYSPTLEFSINENIMKITVQASEDTLSYELETEILLDNNSSGDITGSTTIYYESPTSNNFVKSNDTFKSSDARLSNLEADSGTLNPNFDPSEYTYTVILPSTHGAQNLITVATPYDSNAIDVDIDDAPNVHSTDIANRTTTITVTAEDGVTTKSYYVIFEVSTSSILVDGVTITPSMITISKHDTLTLIANVTPLNASNPIVNWSIVSGDDATIDSTGTLTPNSNANGIVTVQATATDGTGEYGTSVITILNN